MHRNVWFAVSTVVTVVAAFALKGIVGDFFAGVACGFLVNIIVGLWFSWAQLSCSTAGYRVKKTVEGTQKIINQEAGRGRERDRYRYSLGVIIDDLEQTFGREGNFNDKEWPCLVDYDPNTHDFSKDEKGKYKDR